MATVDDTLYDHSSIPKTVRTQFAAGQASLTKRDEAANDLLAHLPLLPDPRTDHQPFGLSRPVAVAELAMATTPTTLNEFEGSLLELAGAVKHVLDQPEPAEADGMPVFQHDTDLGEAGRARLMVPGSPASQHATQAVAYFTATTPDDPADPEVGPSPTQQP
jgi:hypothetical protein